MKMDLNKKLLSELIIVLVALGVVLLFVFLPRGNAGGIVDSHAEVNLDDFMEHLSAEFNFDPNFSPYAEFSWIDGDQIYEGLTGRAELYRVEGLSDIGRINDYFEIEGFVINQDNTNSYPEVELTGYIRGDIACKVYVDIEPNAIEEGRITNRTGESTILCADLNSIKGGAGGVSPL